MSFPKYPQYTNSEVDWLGLLPSHWSKTKIGRVSQSGMGQTILKEMLEDVPSSFSLPVYSASEGDDAFGYFPQPSVRLKAGDLVVGARGSIGKTRLIVEESTCTQTTIWVKPSKGLIVGEYLYWVFVGGRESLFPFDKTAIPMLTIDQLKQGWLALPSAFEQIQIARFLDHETARIDALIDEQQRLIELLKEKRQAVISHAVTKGLDPTVQMKDSGVEWLGEVPHNWKVIKFGITHDKAELGGNYESSESEDGLPLIKMGNIGRGKIKLDKVECISIDQNVDLAHMLKEGDFLFNTRNSLDLVGKVCVWRGELASAIYNSNILRISFKNNLIGSSGFVNYLFNSDLGLEQLRLIARGTTSVAAIYYKDLSSLSFAFPPPSEQREIEGFLDIQTSQLDDLVNVAEQTIVLIKERRSALISAAVTGKIDVRGWQPPASTQAPELAVAEAH